VLLSRERTVKEALSCDRNRILVGFSIRSPFSSYQNKFKLKRPWKFRLKSWFLMRTAKKTSKLLIFFKFKIQSKNGCDHMRVPHLRSFSDKLAISRIWSKYVLIYGPILKFIGWYIKITIFYMIFRPIYLLISKIKKWKISKYIDQNIPTRLLTSFTVKSGLKWTPPRIEKIRER